MKKIFIIILFPILYLSSANVAKAASCPGLKINGNSVGNTIPTILANDGDQITFSISANEGFMAGNDPFAFAFQYHDQAVCLNHSYNINKDANNNLNFTITKQRVNTICNTFDGRHTIEIWSGQIIDRALKPSGRQLCTQDYNIAPKPTPTPSETCTITFDPPAPGVNDDVNVFLQFRSLNPANTYFFSVTDNQFVPLVPIDSIPGTATGSKSYFIPRNKLSNGKTYTAGMYFVYNPGGLNKRIDICPPRSFTVTTAGGPRPPTPLPGTCDPSCFPADCNQDKCKGCNFCVNPPGQAPIPDVSAICGKLSSSVELKCRECFAKNEVFTAVGCIPWSIEGAVPFIFNLGLPIAGGIGFLVIIWASFKILTSQGVPEQINAGRELIISVILGLIIIVFSVLIYGIITGSILGLPGFKLNP